MKQAILVAHGSGEPKFAIDKRVKTITKADEYLSFDKAREYMDSEKAWPEYASTSFGDFDPLSDNDCTKLFGLIPNGVGIVSTGKRRGKHMDGPLIYALRGSTTTADGIKGFVQNNGITSMVLLACRKA